MQSATNQHKEDINNGIIKLPLICACANIKASNSKANQIPEKQHVIVVLANSNLVPEFLFLDP